MPKNFPEGSQSLRDHAPEQRLARIRRILEHKIVPSLIIDPNIIRNAGPRTREHDTQTDAIMAMALQGRLADAEDDLRALFEAGASFEQLQLGLLAPAAERLGKLWENDSLSFVDVTIATGTLQRLMHFVAIDLANTPVIGGDRTICIFPEPGAEHTFGAGMAAKFFQHAGWQVEYVPDANVARLREIVRSRDIDVLGLSLNRPEEAPRAEAVLHDLRRASRNAGILTIAGGSAFSRAPELIASLQVDAVVAAVASAPADITEIVAERRR